MRWTAVSDVRSVETDEPVNRRIRDNAMEIVCEECQGGSEGHAGWCSNAPEADRLAQAESDRADPDAEG
jgi:hypothetical protein